MQERDCSWKSGTEDIKDRSRNMVVPTEERGGTPRRTWWYPQKTSAWCGWGGLKKDKMEPERPGHGELSAPEFAINS